MFAQVLAGSTVALTPWLLRASNAMSLNAYEPFFWGLGCLLFLTIVVEDRPALWPALGLVLGLGIMLKPTILLMAFGMAVGLVTTSRRSTTGWMRPASRPPSTPPASAPTAMTSAAGQTTCPEKRKKSAAAVLTVKEIACFSALSRVKESSSTRPSTASTIRTVLACG